MADLYELETILNYVALTEKYQEKGRAGGPNPLYDFYTAGTPKPYQTDQVEFIKLGTVKDPAPLNARGNPARVLTPTGKEKRRLTMYNSFDAIRLGMDSLQMIRHPEQWSLQQKGKEEIEQQFEDFGTRHAVTKRLIVSKTLSSQFVYIDAAGDILEDSTGAVAGAATGIPSSNLSQIAKTSFGMGSGNIIDKAWDDPTAKILDHLDLMNEAAEYNNAEALAHVWLHKSNKIWIRANDQILEQYGSGGGNPNRLDNDLKGDTFEFNNYTFHFYGGTYTKTDGNTGYYVPKTQAIITPDPANNNWIAVGNGMQLVCNSIDVMPASSNAMTDWDEVYGDFAYVVKNHNPPSVDLFMGFNWLFGLRNPASVFAPTVDF